MQEGFPIFYVLFISSLRYYRVAIAVVRYRGFSAMPQALDLLPEGAFQASYGMRSIPNAVCSLGVRDHLPNGHYLN